MLRLLQKGFNYSQDGPGNRLVYHLQGCNLHCPWCSNPESMAPLGSLLVTDAARLRPDACPYGAISAAALNREVCRNCGTYPCTQMPGSGIRLTGTPIPEEEVLEEAERCRPLFFDGGGVTFTGGEPTLQWDALSSLLRALHGRGVHTAIETNGTHPRLPTLFPFIGHLILDVKHYDPRRHREVVGPGLEQIRKNFQAALAEREQIAVRIPLIGGFNAGEEDAAAFAAFFKGAAADGGVSLPGGLTVELLPYHEYGRDKWAQCGMQYVMGEEAFVGNAQAARFAAILRDNGLTVLRT